MRLFVTPRTRLFALLPPHAASSCCRATTAPPRLHPPRPGGIGPRQVPSGAMHAAAAASLLLYKHSKEARPDLATLSTRRAQQLAAVVLVCSRTDEVVIEGHGVLAIRVSGKSCIPWKTARPCSAGSRPFSGPSSCRTGRTDRNCPSGRKCRVQREWIGEAPSFLTQRFSRTCQVVKWRPATLPLWQRPAPLAGTGAHACCVERRSSALPAEQLWSRARHQAARLTKGWGLCTRTRR